MTRLTNCKVSFHTHDEDKAWDTKITIIVYDENQNVTAHISNHFGHFPTHSDKGPFCLTLLNNSPIEALKNGSMAIAMHPGGNNTWAFNLFIDLQFDDGETHLSGNVEALVLSPVHRIQAFNLNQLMHFTRPERGIGRGHFKP